MPSFACSRQLAGTIIAVAIVKRNGLGICLANLNMLAAEEGLDPMARKITTTVVCDLPHDDEVVSKETVSFSFEGTAYEIDVCTAHAKELHDKFGAYTGNARRAGSSTRRRRARSGPGRERSAEIRAWARDKGHKVSERGRIPATIISEYEAAH
jgi:hypothetical protein